MRKIASEIILALLVFFGSVIDFFLLRSRRRGRSCARGTHEESDTRETTRKNDDRRCLMMGGVGCPWGDPAECPSVAACDKVNARIKRLRNQIKIHQKFNRRAIENFLRNIRESEKEQNGKA